MLPPCDWAVSGKTSKPKYSCSSRLNYYHVYVVFVCAHVSYLYVHASFVFVCARMCCICVCGRNPKAIFSNSGNLTKGRYGWFSIPTLNVRVCVYVCVCLNACVHLCVCLRSCRFVRACLSGGFCVRVGVFACVYVHLCVLTRSACTD